MARAANRYPDIQLSYEPSGRLAAAPGETVVLAVALERELAGDLTPVYAPRCAPGAAGAGSCSWIVSAQVVRLFGDRIC